MIFILIFQFFTFFPQEKIDMSMPSINKFYEDSMIVLSHCNAITRINLRNFLQHKKILPEFDSRADIIIGDTPGETLLITGYFYNAGNVFVINDGVLRLKHADFNLDGNIYVLNKGKLLVDSSYLKFLQNYIYQYGITFKGVICLYFLWS